MKMKLQIYSSYSIANIFVITSLILLLIYGADVVWKNFNTNGFLPLDTLTRGIIFGAIPVALSITAFIRSIREKSVFVSTLLIINGIIMIIGGLIIAFNLINSSENALLISIVSGIAVTSLGIYKKVGFRNITSGKNTLTQH